MYIIPSSDLCFVMTMWIVLTAVMRISVTRGMTPTEHLSVIQDCASE